MTFGEIKSIIENNLLKSYNNKQEFKKSLKEFKQDVLNNKNMSRLYSLYDQLTTPQGLTETEAKDFLEEGINLIQKLTPTIKTTRISSKNVSNQYINIDSLVYVNKLDLMERVQSKKNLIKILVSSKPEPIKESINLPLKSMINIANQTMNGYIENLDESAKKEFIQLRNEYAAIRNALGLGSGKKSNKNSNTKKLHNIKRKRISKRKRIRKRKSKKNKTKHYKNNSYFVRS